MSDAVERDLESRLSRSLHARAPRPAPGTADRCLRLTAAAEQRRGWMGLGFRPVLAAAAVVVLAVVVGLGLGNILPRGGNIGDDTPIVVPSSSPSEAASVTPAPTATPSAVPSPSPSPSGAVFEGGNRCTNEEIGFTVGYPGDWWANEAQDFEDPALTDIAACFAFSEEPAEIRPNSELPPGIAIVAGITEEPAGNPQQPIEVLDTRETNVAGRPAVVEEIEWTEDDVFQRAGDRSYGYRITLASGQILAFTTGTDELTSLEEYEAHKGVLDDMMQTLELGGS